MARKTLILVFGISVVVSSLLGAAEAPPLPRDLDAGQYQAGGDRDTGEDWLLYGRNHKAWRFSPLTRIDKGNVKELNPVWTLGTGLYDAFETSPVVAGGVMYFTTPWNHVFAVNAATGERYWRYAYPLPHGLSLCCGAVNHGAGIGSGKVVFAALDASLAALDAKTGRPVWRTVMADYRQGYSAAQAPQIIGKKVIVGISGGEFGIRGFIDAYDIDSGKRLWRFRTIPGPGEQGNETWEKDSWKTGGGAAALTCAYDARTDTIFAGIGGPGPVLKGEDRKGSNLYTDCIVALDAGDGRLKWYYQTIPHDVWHMGSVLEPVIDDITVDGQDRKVVMFASKNGYFYVLDRLDGSFLYAVPFSHFINWGTVGQDGKAIVDESKYPAHDKWTEIFPGAAGATGQVFAAYDPRMKRMFIPCIENGHQYKLTEQEFKPGLSYWGGVAQSIPNAAYGHVAAIDVEKKRVVWDIQTMFPLVCGITCTAAGLVITGTPDQKMVILDSDSGRELWSFRGLSGWHSAPVVYSVAGREYIAFANGWGGRPAGFDDTASPGLQGCRGITSSMCSAYPRCRGAAADSREGAVVISVGVIIINYTIDGPHYPGFEGEVYPYSG